MARRKKRKVFGKGAETRGTTGIVVEDEVTPFMLIAAANFPKELDRAIRHVGFEIHDNVKRYIRRDGHNKSLTPIQEERTIDRARTRGARLRRKKFAGDLNQKGKSIEKAVQYEHKEGSMKAIVGFASNDARKVSGKDFQEGRTYRVTMKMKKMFFALAEKSRGKQKRRLLNLAHMPVNKKIKIPGRPIFDPVYARLQSAIPRLLEKRVERNLNLLDEASYQAILLSETGINDNIRKAEEAAVKGRRRVK